MLRMGLGVPQDLVRAHMWYTLAASAEGEVQEDAGKSLRAY